MFFARFTRRVTQARLQNIHLRSYMSFWLVQNPISISMHDQTIQCPKCGNPIPLSETLTHQITAEIEQEVTHKFNKEKEDFIQKEKAKMWAIAQEKAQEKLQSEMKAKEEEIGEQKKKLEELEKHELDLRREKRLLEEEKRKLNLEVERRIDEMRKKVVDDIVKEKDEENRLKFLEKEKQMEQMRRQIEDLKRKSEQGSMQVQGDALETDLKMILKTNFPLDSINDVPTGITGADLVQVVNATIGAQAGTILWESKNTKEFSNAWINKLKDDGIKAKADVCVLVTKIMPLGMNVFGELKGVFVVEWKYVVALTTILRSNIISLANMKRSLDGSGKKMEYLYQYLISPEFKGKIENIINAFTSLKTELDREKRAMSSIWSRREKEIDRVLNSTSSLYGDLQGATGNALPKIEKLELPEGDEDISLSQDNDDSATLF